MKTVLDVLEERGFVEQVTDRNELTLLLKSPATCYAGFDPTAESLHVGHLLPIMALAHMQRAGHCPIILLGGGTALIGDPSGKSDMRRMLSYEEISNNTEKIKKQFSRYMTVDDPEKAMVLNNADWLLDVTYIEFLRDIGKHFSVNRMIAAESYKMRLETGLNFIEFNYMLLQAYDFLHLFKKYGCVIQLGGNDQWGNIVAGIDLIRRVCGSGAYGLTFPLITTSSGAKMGKTEKGAVWIDPDRTSPYEYYQFWINTDDRDVKRFLMLFTFMHVDEIEALCERTSTDAVKNAKETLAYEATSITHGVEEAAKARQTARSVFYGQGTPDMESLPATAVPVEELQRGIPAFLLYERSALCSTRSEARRLISDGGAYVNGEKISEFDQPVTEAHVKDGVILLRAGKKRYHKIVPE